ncbi:hypothetical protein IAR55_003676 [Kwoniella newhampshirensis]|uniref:Uncharacterized protein n=1 Tax=Kwoniella newhampshirensis TaxID=1651941 RepID=A0AAW0YZJ9_9TREE
MSTLRPSPSRFETVVIYDALLPYPGAVTQVREDIKVTMDGTCWVGTEAFRCDQDLLGEATSRLIPFLRTYQIFFSLFAISLILGAVYGFFAKPDQAMTSTTTNTSMAPRRSRWLGRCILSIMVLQDLIAVFGVVPTSCLLLIVPLFDTSPTTAPDHIIGFSPGWGFLLALLLTAISCAMTLEFDIYSKELEAKAEAEMQGLLLVHEVKGS